MGIVGGQALPLPVTLGWERLWVHFPARLCLAVLLLFLLHPASVKPPWPCRAVLLLKALSLVQPLCTGLPEVRAFLFALEPLSQRRARGGRGTGPWVAPAAHGTCRLASHLTFVPPILGLLCLLQPPPSTPQSHHLIAPLSLGWHREMVLFIPPHFFFFAWGVP